MLPENLNDAYVGTKAGFHYVRADGQKGENIQTYAWIQQKDIILKQNRLVKQ